MTNAKTRAELNRLLAADESDLTVDDLLRLPAGAVSLLRLLVKSQQALRKINGLLQHQLNNEDPDDLVTILHLLDALMIIAKTACKEE